MLFCRLWNSFFKEFFYLLQKIVPSLSSVLWQDAGKPNQEIAWLFRKFMIYYFRIHLTDHEFLLHLKMNQKLPLIVITIWYLQQLLSFEDVLVFHDLQEKNWTPSEDELEVAVVTDNYLIPAERTANWRWNSHIHALKERIWMLSKVESRVCRQ